MSTISIKNLRKTYGPYVAVDDLTFEIPDACVFGLLGPNGAGKTTTFKCMLGLARATSGSVLYDGAPLVPETLERIAYVPERSVLYEWMTVGEHIEMQRRAYRKFSVARARELLAQFGIDLRKKARALSKGMRTATMVALAIARESDILILDEPTSGLDPINQRHVLNLIINESARGATVIFSSHQIGQVERAAERIAVIDRGRLALEGNVDDLKADRKIVEGILPSETFALNGLAGDPHILRLDRNGRIVRAVTSSDAGEVLAKFEALGASGLRIVDLNLEDIFLYAVSPADATADVVEGH
ncbi:MAG TPA: ABC transporter ATP-binding protein [Candidatus Acidoferrum sp.]|jgi:ABC-2 type transport system ATP-binding protein|nr:ABC transporter ATP-binding protein [Candidatus Acidoferrum sp.]